ncbi:MAG: hypothetical protein JXL20_11705 [Deltaproteobacteria bacterium]|nr:hypothetical protein [Deltaproteobacteria bacterium]
MSSTEKKGIIRLKSRKGFALVTAILAIMILMALGYLAVSVTTGDLKITSRIVGEKKALSAAETGVHRLMQNFDPASMAGSELTAQVDASTDPDSRYTISNIALPTFGPAMRPLVGYAIGGGQQWGQRCYTAQVEGENTRYDSSVQIALGMGYGPIEISTMSR